MSPKHPMKSPPKKLLPTNQSLHNAIDMLDTLDLAGKTPTRQRGIQCVDGETKRKGTTARSQ